jgi:ABC-2 type transport system ATP-binding protein
MLYGFLTPDAGEIRFQSADVRGDLGSAKRSIGVCTQEDTFDGDFTVEQNLRIAAEYFRPRPDGLRDRVAHLLDRFELRPHARQKPETLSGGYRRRLMLARAIVHRPRILFLDEPTTGLDPNARKSVWRMIRALAGEGVTILLTTQYLEEADQLAARIAVIDHGRKIAEGTSRELKAATGSGFLHVTLTDPARIDAAAQLLEQKLGGEAQRNAEGAVLSIKANSPHEANAALTALAAAGISIEGFSMAAPSLDEVFFALTGHGAENASATGAPK